MVVQAQTTNPFGRTFISYRHRSALNDISQIVRALNSRGVPTYRDLDNLPSCPTGDELIDVLESPETASTVWWLTPDVEHSKPILDLEAPRILKRTRAADTFFSEICLANGLDWHKVNTILTSVRTVERLGSGWNLKKYIGPIGIEEARKVAVDVLHRRLEAICNQLQHDEPLRLIINTRADSPLSFTPGAALQLDWSPSFIGRTSAPSVWQGQLLPSLFDIITALQKIAPRRRVLAEGTCCLPAAFGLGQAFMEPTRVLLSWKQFTAGEYSNWSLYETPQDSGFIAEDHHIAFDSSALGVMVNVRNNNVEAAVHGSGGSVPPFGAVVRVHRPNATDPQALDSPGQATHLARLVVNAIRSARDKHSNLETIHIFMSGPVGLGMLIGQQLNGLGPVHTYEHLQDGGPGRYVPAAILTDTLTDLSRID